MTTPDEKTFATLTKLFEEEFGPIGDRQVLYVHAPGRSEISGNHTDHEGWPRYRRLARCRRRRHRRGNRFQQGSRSRRGLSHV